MLNAEFRRQKPKAAHGEHDYATATLEELGPPVEARK
jgi:hypothetical protein